MHAAVPTGERKTKQAAAPEKLASMRYINHLITAATVYLSRGFANPPEVWAADITLEASPECHSDKPINTTDMPRY